MLDDQRIHVSAVDLCGAAASAAIAADAGAVKSNLEYVLDEQAGLLGADQRRVLEAAWRNARRILKFAEDLRDLALAEAGELPLEQVRCDLRPLVDDAVERSWPDIRVDRKTIEVEVEGEPSPSGDPVQLARAVTALVEYAVEHSLPGTGITVSLTEDAITLAFATNSSPLDDPLGLALASAVAKLHGGRLFVEPEGGQTALTLTFGSASAAKAA